MPNTLRTRKLLRDWQSAEQRMAGHTPEPPIAIRLMQGIVCIGLVLVMLFLLWQIFTPAGKAILWEIAVFIWEAV